MEYYKNLSLEILVEEIDGVLYVEEWKDIYGWEDMYQISSFGRCKTKARWQVNYRAGKAWNEAKILKQNKRGNYFTILLYRNDEERSRVSVHRLVLMNFSTNPDKKPYGNHINGNKKDNRKINLEWSTAKENIRHAWNMGLMIKNTGENSNFAKLKPSQVLEIRKMFDSGDYIYREIAAKFNIAQTTVGAIGNREVWKHI